jgi:hypothetical protein
MCLNRWAIHPFHIDGREGVIQVDSLYRENQCVSLLHCVNGCLEPHLDAESTVDVMGSRSTPPHPPG